jgi:proline iminopeptidase
MRTATETLVTIGDCQLFVRELGTGHPLIALHGGPEFDSFYLVPELDALAGCCRLIYYDQRGRGRSAAAPAEQVTIESEVDDLDRLRDSFGADSIAVLGHSWGGVLAMEYATRHPDRVSHLILLNTAPASARDWTDFLPTWRGQRSQQDAEALTSLTASAAFTAGDVHADTALYRIVFRNATRRAELDDQIVGRLRAHFTPDRIVASHVIEDRLFAQTLELDGYDLVPRLRELAMPTLVVHGEDDFVPVAMAARIADAIPGARIDVLPACGHFSYAERPEAVRDVICAFLRSP